jgi:pilus assembly protein CpaB
MRANSVLILVLAIVLGGLAAFLARNWLVNRTQVSTGATVVVATKHLPFGTPLTDDSVQEISWGAETLPVGAFQSKDALSKGGVRTTLTAVEQGEPIMSSKVTGPGQRASLSTMIDKDKRAITIRVDDVRGVAGFILPGDRVDVVMNRSDTDTGSRKNYSDLLLQDVKVIAVDQISAEQKDRPTVAKAVTLEVTPQQAQKISLATDVGHLSLILRKSGDSNVVTNQQVTESDLLGGSAIARATPVEKPTRNDPAPIFPQDATVTVIRDLKSQDYKVFRDVR